MNKTNPKPVRKPGPKFPIGSTRPKRPAKGLMETIKRRRKKA